MKVSIEELGNIDFVVTSVRSQLHIWNEDTIFDYESTGRVGNLLYYNLNNEIDYHKDGTKICTVFENDILFLPSGSKYTSKVKGSKGTARGISIVFEIATRNREPIDIDTQSCVLISDKERYFYEKFHNVYLSDATTYKNSISLNLNFYSLLYALSMTNSKKKGHKGNTPDIFNAIHALECAPHINYKNEQLADFCYMSISTFLRKFKTYSGGMTPLQYRNNVRITRAEELINTSLTLDEIAVRLGFYDGAHLCKVYKKMKGTTPKKKT